MPSEFRVFASVSEATKQAIADQAKRDKRTLSAWVAWVIEKELAKRKEPEANTPLLDVLDSIPHYSVESLEAIIQMATAELAARIPDEPGVAAKVIADNIAVLENDGSIPRARLLELQKSGAKLTKGEFYLIATTLEWDEDTMKSMRSQLFPKTNGNGTSKEKSNV